MRILTSRFIRLPILLILLLISGCTDGLEADLPPTIQILAPPATLKGEPTTLPTAQSEGSAEKAQSTDSLEVDIMDPIANADVLFVRAVKDKEPNSWTFHVTVQHLDTGWEDYADGWDVVLPDGKVIKPDPEAPYTRLLLHPHEAEQPFTRSQTGILIPDGITTVQVRAHDLVDGFGGKEIIVDLSADSGPGFEIIR
jgi:hypothetical protein